MNGLIIREPWIDLILEGKKIWEIRGSNTKRRGKIALIKSKTGKVFGTVDVINSILLTTKQYHEAFNNHYIPNTKDNPLPYRKNYAWILENPIILEEPIPYIHPRGAVIWVTLDDTFENI